MHRFDFGILRTISYNNPVAGILINAVCHTKSKNQMAVSLSKQIVKFERDSDAVHGIVIKRPCTIGIGESYIIPESVVPFES